MCSINKMYLLTYLFNAWAPPTLKHESLLSALAASFLFREQPRAVPLFSSQGPARKTQRGRGFQHSVQKKKDMTDCLPWMSQWPRISACPQPLVGRQNPPTRQSHVGLLQLSLDEPSHRLDKRPWCFTPWRSCKCSRQNSSVQWTSLTQTLSFQRAGNRQIHGQSCGA